MRPSRLPLLFILLGLLITAGILLRPSTAIAPATPSAPADTAQASSAVLQPPEGIPNTSQLLLKRARDCLYTLEMAKTQLYIIDLGRSTRSREQIEVESREALDRVRLYADRLGNGLASPFREGRWVVVADGMPVVLVDESTGAVTTYEGHALCPSS